MVPVRSLPHPSFALPHTVCVFRGSAASCRRRVSALQSFCPSGIALLLAAVLHQGSVLVSQPRPQPPNAAVLPAVTFFAGARGQCACSGCITSAACVLPPPLGLSPCRLLGKKRVNHFLAGTRPIYTQVVPSGGVRERQHPAGSASPPRPLPS